ncbi:hypothetical protein PG994_009867 [Apiospora phragmitis]|uniref:Uncharacterized protein n=1 Tax=Apiospora phragmitis TaxID=2905665 RepID=A0ABR1TNG0_9PEZI
MTLLILKTTRQQKHPRSAQRLPDPLPGPPQPAHQRLPDAFGPGLDQGRHWIGPGGVLQPWGHGSCRCARTDGATNGSRSLTSPQCCSRELRSKRSQYCVMGFMAAWVRHGYQMVCSMHMVVAVFLSVSSLLSDDLPKKGGGNVRKQGKAKLERILSLDM